MRCPFEFESFLMNHWKRRFDLLIPTEVIIIPSEALPKLQGSIRVNVKPCRQFFFHQKSFCHHPLSIIFLTGNSFILWVLARAIWNSHDTADQSRELYIKPDCSYIHLSSSWREEKLQERNVRVNMLQRAHTYTWSFFRSLDLFILNFDITFGSKIIWELRRHSTTILYYYLIGVESNLNWWVKRRGTFNSCIVKFVHTLSVFPQYCTLFEFFI